MLGPARGEGNEICPWVLKANGNVVPRKSHRPLRPDDIHKKKEQKKRETFDALIERRWSTAIMPPKVTENADGKEDWEEYGNKF